MAGSCDLYLLTTSEVCKIDYRKYFELETISYPIIERNYEKMSWSMV